MYLCVVIFVQVLVGCSMCCGGFFVQAEDGIRDLVRSRGLGDVYKRQDEGRPGCIVHCPRGRGLCLSWSEREREEHHAQVHLSLIHI